MYERKDDSLVESGRVQIKYDQYQEYQIKTSQVDR
jgi:hypothetical protein